MPSKTVLSASPSKSLPTNSPSKSLPSTIPSKPASKSMKSTITTTKTTYKLSAKPPLPCPRVKPVAFNIQIPRLLSRIETLQIVFEKAPITFRLFDISLYRLEETVHQLSTMLLALDVEQRERMDVQSWLDEAWRLLQLVRTVVNEAFEKNGRLTKIWKKMLRVKVEGAWFDNHRATDLSLAVLEHCVKLNRRYERLLWDLLRARGEEGEGEESD